VSSNPRTRLEYVSESLPIVDKVDEPIYKRLKGKVLYRMIHGLFDSVVGGILSLLIRLALGV
jgi:hypothetical protein